MKNNTVKDPHDREYIAFISYRHMPLDKKAAELIQKRIENYVVPKELRNSNSNGGKHLGTVFRDEDELPASSNLSESITHALDRSKFLIVICTPDLPKSKWCEAEIKYFLKTHDNDHILAILVDGSPEESFSPYLCHSFDEDGNITDNREPLAANIVGQNHTIDRKALDKEIVRVYAALLGCPFDVLWQRERRTRMGKIAALLSMVILIMAVFFGVVFYKNLEIRKMLMTSYSNEGTRLSLEGRPQEAMAYFARVLSQDPGNKTSKIGALIALQQQGWIVSEGQNIEVPEVNPPPQSLSEFGELTQAPWNEQNYYVFTGSDTVRVWLPENDTVYEMARMKELDPKVEFSPDYADEVSPAVVPMVNEDEVWFIQAYGGYISLFQFNGELSVKEPGTVGSCQLNRTFSIEEIYEECGYSSSKKRLTGNAGYSVYAPQTYQWLWTCPETGMVAIKDMDENVITILNIFSGKTVRCFDPMNDDLSQVMQVAFRKDGLGFAFAEKTVNTATNGNMISIYDENGQRTGRSTADYHNGSGFPDIEYSSDEKMLMWRKLGCLELLNSRSLSSLTAPLYYSEIEDAGFLENGDIQLRFKDKTYCDYSAIFFSPVKGAIPAVSQKSSEDADPKDWNSIGDITNTEDGYSLHIEYNYPDCELQLLDLDGNVADSVLVDWVSENDGMFLHIFHNGSTVYLKAEYQDFFFRLHVSKDTMTLSEPEKVTLPDFEVKLPEPLLPRNSSLYPFDGCCAVSSGQTIYIYEDSYGEKNDPIHTLELDHDGYYIDHVALNDDGLLAALVSIHEYSSGQYRSLSAIELWDYQKEIHLANLEDQFTGDIQHDMVLNSSLSYHKKDKDAQDYEECHWLIATDDPDSDTVRMLSDICCYSLSDDQMLELKEPVFKGSTGNWGRLLDVRR